MGIATSLYEDEDERHKALRNRVNRMHGKVKKWDNMKQ